MVRLVLIFAFSFFHMSAMIARTCDSQAMHASDGSSRLGEKLILISFYFGFTSFGKKLSFQILKLIITCTCCL